MTLEELTKALGLDTDENKDKASILKKEYNAQQRELNKAKKDLEASNKSLEDNKASLEKLDIVKKAFNLDFEAEDIDTMIQEKKDEMLKEAGGGATPDEIKELNRELTKLKRQTEKDAKQISELTENLTKEQNMRIDGVKKTAIRKELEKNHVIKPDMFVDMFSNRATVDKDGKTVMITGDDGAELSIVDYIADFANDESNSAFIEKQVHSGFGSNGSNGNGANTGVSDFMAKIIGDNKSGNENGDGASLAESFG